MCVLMFDLVIDVNLMDQRPSVVARAATLVALDRKLTRETMEIEINSFSPSGLLEIVSPQSNYFALTQLLIQIQLKSHFLMHMNLLLNSCSI